MNQAERKIDKINVIMTVKTARQITLNVTPVD
jgi:hypothetical protein